MKHWIMMALLAAFTLGCGSSGDGTQANSADSAADDSETLDLPEFDDKPPSEAASPDDTSQVRDTATTLTADRSLGATSDGDLPVSKEALPAEDETAEIKREMNRQLNQAITDRNIPAAIRALEDGLEKLPGDVNIGAALVALRIRNDNTLAARGVQEEVVASIRKTGDYIKNILADTEKIPRPLQSTWYLNEARMHAYDNNVQKSLAALELAYQNGLGQYAAMAEDPFLKTLKDNAEFKELLAAHTKRLQAKYRQLARQEIETTQPFEFDFTLTDINDQPIQLSDLAGKVVVADIWGTWCGPCRMEIPHLIRLQDEYKDDLVIVGIAYEHERNRARAKQSVLDFVRTNGVNYPCVMGDEPTRKQIPNMRSVPTTVFIGRSGKVRLRIDGYRPYEQLQSYVAELVEDTTAKSPT